MISPIYNTKLHFSYSRKLRDDSLIEKCSDFYLSVVDGSSKEGTEKLMNRGEGWSSFMLVVLIGIVLTLTIIGAAVLLVAKANSGRRTRGRNTARQQALFLCNLFFDFSA